MPQKRKSASPDQVATPPIDTRRKKTDWDAVERDYRTGNFSDAELAIKHGVARESIVRRRKSDQQKDPTTWAQDLAPQVRAATNALLMQETVAQKVTEGHTQVTGVILAAAEVNTQVILGHRKGLQRITAIKDVLLDQIQAAAANLPDLVEVIEMVRNPDENGVDKANDALKKALARSGLVDDLKKLAEVDERVRKGEREAFGIGSTDEPPPGQKPKRILLDFVDVEVKG